MTQKKAIHCLAVLVLASGVGAGQGCSKNKTKASNETGKPVAVQETTGKTTRDAAAAKSEARDAHQASPSEARQGSDQAPQPEENVPAGAVQAQVIIVSWKGAMDGVNRTKAQAKTLAEKVLAEAAGKPFDKLVKQYSDGPNKGSGGKVPPMTKKDASAVFQPVFSLKVGQVSKVIEGPNGYYIFKRIK